MEYKNYQVEKAGVFYNAHCNRMYARLQFRCFTLDFPIQSIPKLFGVFEIDAENGAYLDEITSKYCRIGFLVDKRAVEIKNIIEDISINFDEERLAYGF